MSETGPYRSPRCERVCVYEFGAESCDAFGVACMDYAGEVGSYRHCGFCGEPMTGKDVGCDSCKVGVVCRSDYDEPCSHLIAKGSSSQGGAA